MAQARVVDRRGVSLELQPGTYRWCACGRSRSQPFCDDSHVGTDIEPIAIVLHETTRVKLCLCKRSKHAPRCDGTHNTVSEAEVDGPMGTGA